MGDCFANLGSSLPVRLGEKEIVYFENKKREKVITFER